MLQAKTFKRVRYEIYEHIFGKINITPHKKNAAVTNFSLYCATQLNSAKFHITKKRNYMLLMYVHTKPKIRIQIHIEIQISLETR